MKKSVLGLALLMLSATLARSDASSGDWSEDFALPGAESSVYCAVEYDGSLVLGGAFTHVDLSPTTRVARWDGNDWQPMGDGFDGAVRDLVVINGSLYAAGEFGHSGATAVNGIARWDGAAWQPLAVQPDFDSVLSLCLYQGRLVVAGILDWYTDEYHYFEQGGLSAYDGYEWTSLATFEWGWASHVSDMVVYEGDLVVQGAFEGLDGDYGIRNLARWDGGSWSSMGYLYEPCDFEFFEGELLTGDYSGVFRWTGAAWEEFPGDLPGNVRALLSFDGGLVACGNFDIDGGRCAAFWDGAAWSALGAPFGNPANIVPPTLTLLGSYQDQLFIGGGFRQANHSAMNRLALWDGSAWVPFASPSHLGHYGGLDWSPYGLGTFAGSLVAGGPFDFGFDSALNGVGEFDGDAWKPLGAGLPDRFDSIYCFEELDGELVAGGTFAEIDSVPALNVAAWNGTGWHALGAGLPFACRALRLVGSTLFAAGGSSLRAWDGTSWQDLAIGLDGTIIDLHAYQGELVAVGTFATDDLGQPLNFIGRWDGAGWQPFGGGFDAQASALVEWNDQLVASGSFTLADGQPASHIARWDGQQWQPFPGVVTGNVTALAVYHGDLIAGGWISAIDGEACGGIARWNGASWELLGTGLAELDYSGASLYDLEVVDDWLYACGTFRVAGGHMSYAVGRWSDAPTGVGTGSSPAAPHAANFPNPFNPATTIRCALPAAAPVTLRVLDPAGRCVRTLLSAAPQPAGPFTAIWDGRDDSGYRLASGVYLYRLEAGDFRVSGKMTLLK